MTTKSNKSKTSLDIVNTNETFENLKISSKIKNATHNKSTYTTNNINSNRSSSNDKINFDEFMDLSNKRLHEILKSRNMVHIKEENSKNNEIHTQTFSNKSNKKVLLSKVDEITKIEDEMSQDKINISNKLSNSKMNNSIANNISNMNN